MRGYGVFKMIQLRNVTRKRCLPNPDIATDFARKIEGNPPKS